MVILILLKKNFWFIFIKILKFTGARYGTAGVCTCTNPNTQGTGYCAVLIFLFFFFLIFLWNLIEITKGFLRWVKQYYSYISEKLLEIIFKLLPIWN